MIDIVNMRPEHIPQLVEHQKICFPTLDPNDLFSAENFEAHLRVFPQGQFVAVDGERVIGQSSTFRVYGSKVFTPHLFHEIVGHGFFTEHSDDGEWLYAADMSVHPDYRGQRIATRLYDRRKQLVRELGIRGIVGGAMIPGYIKYRDVMDTTTYMHEVVAGRIIDPTLTAQLRNGFRAVEVIKDHIHAGELGPDAVLIVWEP